MLKDIFEKYYFDGNYNCAETMIRAANEYYSLGLHDRDMILVVNSWSKNSVPHVPHEGLYPIGYTPNSWYVPDVPHVPDVK